MRNTLYVVLAVAVVLLLAGCVKLNIYNKINQDHSGTYNMSFDLTPMVNYMKLVNSSFQGFSDADMEKICANLTSSSEEQFKRGAINETQLRLMKRFKCSHAGQVVTLSLDYTKDDPIESVTGATIEENATHYIVRIQTNTSDFKKLNISESQIASLKAMGFEMKYTIEMPGPIVSAPNAVNINGNVATFDLLQEMTRTDSGPIVVVAAKPSGGLGGLWLVIIGVIVVILIIVIVLLMMRKKGQEKEAEE